MGLDSVELVMAVEEEFQLALADEDAIQATTVGKLVDLVLSKLRHEPDQPCLSQQGFYRVRQVMMKELSIPRDQIKPDLRLADVIEKDGRQQTWQNIMDALTGDEKTVRPADLVRPRRLAQTVFLFLPGLAFVLSIAPLPLNRWLLAFIPAVFVGIIGGIVTKSYKSEFPADVTGMDSTSKLKLVRSTGVDQVIDYTEEDFTRRGERYDLIFDIPGNQSLSDCRRALTSEGTHVLIGHDNYGNGMRRWVGLLPRMFKLMAMSPFVSQLRNMGSSMPDKKGSMDLLRELLESEKLTPYFDKTYPLSEVPEAIRYLQQGRAKGKVVITM